MANLVFVSRSRQTFSKKMKILAEKSNGRPKAAPVKSDARMEGKLNVDHANEDLPKACANVDCIRLGITYDDVDGIKRGYDMVTEKYKPLRVKNTFRRDFDAKSETFGYRCILVNVLFEEEDVTWGDVLEGAKEHILESIEALGYNPGVYGTTLKPALKALLANKTLKKFPLKFIGEVQYLHRDYLEMRKKSHLYYKIYRTHEQDLDNGADGAIDADIF